MPRPNSSERHQKAGVDVHMRRLGVTGAQWFNVGVLNSPPQTNNQLNELESFDERGGSRVLDETSITDFKEQLTIDTRNHEAEVLSLFLGADEPGALAQSMASVADEEHANVKLGGYILLGAPAGGSNPARKYDVSGVAVNSAAAGGGTAFVAGTDFIVDAVKGVIRIPTNSTIPDDSTVFISYDHAAIAAAPLVLPQTAVQGVEVEIELWEVSDDGAKQSVREIPRARVRSGGQRTMGTAQDNFVQLIATVLADSASAAPAGRYIQVKS